MKIKIDDYHDTTIEELKSGDLFEIHGDYYIVTDYRDEEYNIGCMEVRTGSIYPLKRNKVVCKRDHELIIYRTED